jgi:hypothetical protein
MADIIPNALFKSMITAYLAGKTIKATLIMSNSDWQTAQAAMRDKVYVGDISAAALDECDSSNFTWGHGGSGRKTITFTGKVDHTADHATMESAVGTYTWAVLDEDASRSITGVLFHVEGTTDDSDAEVLGYQQFAAPRQADSNDFLVNLNVGDGRLFKINQGV